MHNKRGGKKKKNEKNEKNEKKEGGKNCEKKVVLRDVGRQGQKKIITHWLSLLSQSMHDGVPFCGANLPGSHVWHAMAPCDES